MPQPPPCSGAAIAGPRLMVAVPASPVPHAPSRTQGNGARGPRWSLPRSQSASEGGRVLVSPRERQPTVASLPSILEAVSDSRVRSREREWGLHRVALRCKTTAARCRAWRAFKQRRPIARRGVSRGGSAASPRLPKLDTSPRGPGAFNNHAAPSKWRRPGFGARAPAGHGAARRACGPAAAFGPPQRCARAGDSPSRPKKCCQTPT